MILGKAAYLSGLFYWGRAYVRISASLSERRSCLIAYSRLEAVERQLAGSDHTIDTGRRALVYFAPRPALCTASRAAASFAMPV